MIVDMREKYYKEVIPAMQERFGYKNVMAVPRVEKVAVNIGTGRKREKEEQEEVVKVLSLITGQKPVPCPARKAIAAFDTRAGMIIGYKVTIRGKRMYDFLTRLVHIALPRSRDFQGIDEKSFDASGNLTIGIREHIVFPEMIGEDYKSIFGMEITVVTTAKSKKEGVELLRLMGFPIRKSN